jgi:hypothetical protein
MNRPANRGRIIAVLAAASFALAACDAGSVVMWPWVEIETKTAEAETDPNAPPPPPPMEAVDPLDPENLPEPETVPNPGGNAGAPDAGTPSDDSRPVNEAIPISDTTPPVSAETGQPVVLPPAPTDDVSPGTTPVADPGQPAPIDPSTPGETLPPTEPTPIPEPERPEPTPTPTAPSFFYYPPGKLEAKSGTGSLEIAALVPDMQFPIKDAPSFPQSQVYRYGGGVKGGDQCDARNFTAPWRDNYCETRTTTNTTPWCPAKGVHLGQDIRVGTPEGCVAERKAKAADRTRYAVVAVEDGVISNVGSYSITLRADSGGRIYRYLHLNMAKLKVATGQKVKKGDLVGYVSNDFGGTPTTLHLHFEIKLNTAENGWQYAPPYASLVAAYQRRESNLGEMVEENVAVATAPR